MALRERTGRGAPLGATVVDGGVNFSLFSRSATGVELVFFDREDDAKPSRVIALDPVANRTYHYWHVFVPGVRPGQIYGYRVSGPSDPASGLRFDPAKVLLDPYGREVVVPDGYSREAASREGDNAATAMKSVVVDPASYDWEGDAPLHLPSSRTIVYEMHVRGFTRHPNSGVDERVRGTYAGLVEKIPYLRALGITAVELLPVFQFDAQACPAGRGQLLGLPARVVLRSAPGVQLPAGAAGPGGRVPRHGQGPAPRGDRSDPRRRVQPHRRGRRGRADARPARDRQPDLLRPGTGRGPLRGLLRLRQHAQRQQPGGPAHDRRQPALLGERDARGRVPLRSRRRSCRATRRGTCCRTRRCCGTSRPTRRWPEPS